MIRLAKEDASAGSAVLELVPPTPVGGAPLNFEHIKGRVFMTRPYLFRPVRLGPSYRSIMQLMSPLHLAGGRPAWKGEPLERRPAP
jgi:hypothetical protein